MSDETPKLKIGRNDPCYCGSGKKYKQCHLSVEQEQARDDRSWESAARFLRTDLIATAREERFAEAFAAAIALFFNQYHTIETAHQMSESESLRFFDWFTYDYSDGERPRLADVYAAEKGATLDERETALLSGWLSAEPACAYVLVAATEPGKQTLHLCHLFDEVEHIVRHSGGPGVAEIGDVFIARLLPYRDHLRLSGATGYLPAKEAVGLKPFILEAWAAEQERSPDRQWDQFLRGHSYLFAHYELDAAEKAGRPPVARLDPNRPKSPLAQVARLAGRRGR
jgi:hypothetical protein